MQHTGPAASSSQSVLFVCFLSTCCSSRDLFSRTFCPTPAGLAQLSPALPDVSIAIRTSLFLVLLPALPRSLSLTFLSLSPTTVELKPLKEGPVPSFPPQVPVVPNSCFLHCSLPCITFISPALPPPHRHMSRVCAPHMMLHLQPFSPKQAHHLAITAHRTFRLEPLSPCAGCRTARPPAPCQPRWHLSVAVRFSLLQPAHVFLCACGSHHLFFCDMLRPLVSNAPHILLSWCQPLAHVHTPSRIVIPFTCLCSFVSGSVPR